MNLLDLMFTNSKGSLSNVRVLDPIHDLDHFPIFATVEFKLRIKCRNKFSRRVWHYENGNYENLALDREIKNTPWHILFENCGSDTDEMVEVFTKLINDITSENVPNYLVNIDPNDKQGMTNKVKNCSEPATDCTKNTKNVRLMKIKNFIKKPGVLPKTNGVKSGITIF